MGHFPFQSLWANTRKHQCALGLFYNITWLRSAGGPGAGACDFSFACFSVANPGGRRGRRRLGRWSGGDASQEKYLEKRSVEGIPCPRIYSKHCRAAGSGSRWRRETHWATVSDGLGAPIKPLFMKLLCSHALDSCTPLSLISAPKAGSRPQHPWRVKFLPQLGCLQGWGAHGLPCIRGPRQCSCINACSSEACILMKSTRRER